jgi:hypothetical protein
MKLCLNIYYKMQCWMGIKTRHGSYGKLIPKSEKKSAKKKDEGKQCKDTEFKTEALIKQELC